MLMSIKSVSFNFPGLFCCAIFLTDDKLCCDMAKDIGNVTCGKLSIDSNKQLSKRCRVIFWKCCRRLHGIKGNLILSFITVFTDQKTNCVLNNKWEDTTLGKIFICLEDNEVRSPDRQPNVFPTGRPTQS